MGGEPGDALDVQVVGRLVEQQDVVAAHQEPGERHPAALPAGEPAERRVETADAGGVAPAEEPGEHVPDGGVGGPDVVGDQLTRADHGVPHGHRRVELVGPGPADPTVTPPARVTRPASGPARWASTRSSVRLAVAVAADDADPVARRRARG